MWNYSYLCSTVLCEDVVTRRAGLARGVTYADTHTHTHPNGGQISVHLVFSAYSRSGTHDRKSSNESNVTP